jgi:hypothetical protein
MTLLSKRSPKPPGSDSYIDILINNTGMGPGSIRPDSRQRPLKFWEITPISGAASSRFTQPHRWR